MIKRQSNFEFLRIISMVMIVAYHLYIHGVYRIGLVSFDTHAWFLENTWNKFFSMLFVPGGEIGVGIFFMLTGYFLSEKDSTHFSRVVIHTVFYAVLSIVLSVSIILYNGGGKQFIGNLIRYVLFPCFEGNWWFVSAYIFLLMLVPFLNRIIKGKVFFFCIFYLYSASLLIGSPHFDIIKAVFFYEMGALFRFKNIKTRQNNFLQTILIFVVVWIFIVFLNVVLILYPDKKMIGKLVTAISSAFFVPAGVWLLFQSFSSITMEDNQIINNIAKTTFGVYLLHDSKVVRYIIWNPILKINDWQIEQKFFPLLVLMDVFIVFVICSIVDYLYQIFVEDKIFIKFGQYLKF